MAKLFSLPFQARIKYRTFILLLSALLLTSYLLYSSWPATSRHSNSKRTVVAVDWSNTEPDSKQQCFFHNCFEVNSCAFGVEDKISVYTYPTYEFTSNKTQESFSPQVSMQYSELVRAVQSSRYYQSQASQACVYIPPIDTLNQASLDSGLVSALLNSLPHWNDGVNHLIFSMLPGVEPSFEEAPSFYYGKAILAGGSFSRRSYRAGFDVSIPVFNALTHSSTSTTRKGSSMEQRPRLLTVIASGGISSSVAWQLDSLLHQNDGSDDDVIVLESCPPGLVSHDQLPWKRCRWNSNEVLPYLETLRHSRFCLLLPSVRRGTPDLLDVLMAGCVPVVSDIDYVLPFSEVLDWTLASVTCWSHDLVGVVRVLQGLSHDTIGQLQNQVHYFYQRYFSSMATITMATLDIINERVYPLSIKGYKWWNMAPTLTASTETEGPILPVGSASLSSASLHDGFTAVILTYDRVPMLFQVITSIAAAPSLYKILIIWNNLNKAPPPTEEWPKINRPIQVILSKQNKLSNRFLPYPEIETAAVFALDDDITMLTTDELEFGFKAWQEFPNRLVGFPGRVHWCDQDGKWQYESSWLSNVSLILTGAAFYHKYYHYLYTHEMSAEVRRWVDHHMNCEDIAMNFLVAQHTGLPPLKVSPRKKFKCASCVSEESLWNDPSHYKERNECINIFSRLFGAMPLKTVKFRLDPVLYGDNIDNRFKAYSNMGEM